MKRNGRVKEEPGADFGGSLKGRTSNVQRPTSNVQLGDQNATVSSGRRFDLEERLLDYAVRIIRLVDALPSTRAGRHVADQLLRCGTSPLANHGELQAAESRRDFIHKLGICLKEIREARRWLRLVHRVPLLAPSKIDPLLGETEALIKIFSASIRTAEKNKG
jgi:four helix bundle protein